MGIQRIQVDLLISLLRRENCRALQRRCVFVSHILPQPGRPLLVERPLNRQNNHIICFTSFTLQKGFLISRLFNDAECKLTSLADPKKGHQFTE